jgi:hypothetical protein
MTKKRGAEGATQYHLKTFVKLGQNQSLMALIRAFALVVALLGASCTSSARGTFILTS